MVNPTLNKAKTAGQNTSSPKATSNKIGNQLTYPKAVMRTLFSIVLVLSCLPCQAQEATLSTRLNSLMDGPDYQHATWSALVTNPKTGEILFSRNPDSLCTPASVTKLFSCAAAMIALGPDSTMETVVYQRGSRKEGVLKGDLILKAAGDLAMGGRSKPDGSIAFQDADHIYASATSESFLTDTNPLAGLDKLAKQIHEAGIQEVTGEVIIDDRLFERASGSGSGPDSITPIMVNDNLIDLLVTPGKVAGQPATVKLIPETEFLRADIDVTTGSQGSAPRLVIEAIDPHHFRVRGSIPVESKPRLRIYPISDPAGFARGLFIEALRRAGVRVNATVVATQRGLLPDRGDYEKLTKVASFESAKLRDIVKVTLKVSHNLYAGALPCLVAVKKGKTTATEGLREQGKILKELGVDVATISFGGGAGGSWADCVTPRATVQLLDSMRKRPEWTAFRDGLPVLGIDGTLATVVAKDSPARGKVFAKTGTLSYDDHLNGRSLLRSKALAGVMTTAKGTELTLALFVNNVPLPSGVATSREGKILGKICELLYEHGP
jgi:serine-type D-Ala-D-Ala carboxypeptidase/endopeptidase (penicillin-binding protein 4)